MLFGDDFFNWEAYTGYDETLSKKAAEHDLMKKIEGSFPMTIREYTDPDWNELMSLYAAVGWTNYTDEPEMLRAAYAHSLCILAAYEDDRLLGVVRAVGDGASIVFIQDILVFPQYQRRGVGKALLCAMMERYRTVYQMELLTDDTEKTVAFYEALGFVRVEKWGCCAFVRG